jgi:hypothetical protein
MKLIEIFRGVFTMRKFWLVLLIGMVLTMDIYGLAKEFNAKLEMQKAKDEVATVVYME